MSAATYDKLDDRLKSISRPSFIAIAEVSKETGALASLPAPPGPEQKVADNYAVGFYLADEAKHDPANFWSKIPVVLGERFGKGTADTGFRWMVAQLLEGAPSVDDLHRANEVGKTAPPDIAKQEQSSLTFDKGRAIARLSASDILADFDHLSPEELGQLSYQQVDELPNELAARLPTNAFLKRSHHGLS